ncbi:MAG: glycosyltransferase [Planctomycetota bacterium]
MSQSERVLFIAERYPPDLGGVARSAGRLSAALARQVKSVDVLAWTKTLPPGQMESQPVHEDAEAGPPVNLHRLGLFANWDLSMQHTLNVLQWLHEREPYHVLWGHYLYPAGFMAVWFAGWTGLRSIVSARGNDVDRMMFPPGDFARLTWTLQHADIVTAVSADLTRKIDLLVGRDRQVEVLRNVVDTEVFTPGPADPELRLALGIQPDECVLGFSGELRHKKGYPFLLAALSEVRRSRPARLLVIGEMRPREQAQLTQYANECPTDAARVIVTGHLKEPADVARHLRLCDVCLLPSIWEGLPNALLEAMACGCICLASDAGGIPEVIDHDKNGFIVSRAMLNHLGAATLDLLAMPPERRLAVSQAARARIVETFHPRAEDTALQHVLARARAGNSS